MSQKRTTPATPKTSASPGAGREGYDFLRPDRIPSSQLRAIEGIRDNAARSMSSSLSAYLGAYIGVNPGRLIQMHYEDFVSAHTAPGVAGVLSLKPADGYAALGMQPGVLFPLLEMLLGRRGNFDRPVRREITDIEQRLIEGLVRIIAQEFRHAWSTIENIEFTPAAIEKEGRLRQLMAPGEPIIAAEFQVHLSDAQGLMSLALPVTFIDRLRYLGPGGWSAPNRPDNEEHLKSTLHAVEDAEVMLDVRVKNTRLRLADLARLSAGDLLVLDHAVADPFTCLVNDAPTLRGVVLMRGRKLALQVTAYEPAPSAAATPGGAAERGAGQ